MAIRRCSTALAAFLTLIVPGLALASPIVSLDSSVFVEREARHGRLLEPALLIAHGDRLVYVVSWYRLGGSGGFVVTNPLPRSVSYQASANGDEDVSVDGGKSWGKLGQLRVNHHLAAPEDVTHVRWKIDPARAAQSSGQIAYSAIVR